VTQRVLYCKRAYLWEVGEGLAAHRKKPAEGRAGEGSSGKVCLHKKPQGRKDPGEEGGILRKGGVACF